MLFLITTSFTHIKSSKGKKEIKKEVILQCSCSTPTGLTSSRIGSNVTLSWYAVSGAICYAYGGYYTTGTGFSGNTSNNYATIPYNGGGTWQVRVICAGTCASPTCSSGTSIAGHF